MKGKKKRKYILPTFQEGLRNSGLPGLTVGIDNAGQSIMTFISLTEMGMDTLAVTERVIITGMRIDSYLEFKLKRQLKVGRITTGLLTKDVTESQV